VQGKAPRRTAPEQQRMTAAQEGFLREWILEQDLLGFPPSRARVRQMACRILRMFGDDEPLDNGWVQEYLQRHPIAKMCGGKPIEGSARTCAAQQILASYDYLNTYGDE